uniref:hypothetical protein n=1 Tax=Eubacterium cellulosolvens TaxID=29322 RepID=UPI000481A4AA|nr:hypothetical protein [[Eubacterium] cellulosolvens]
MRKKLLALLLATSTISSTLLPAQCVFAGTTGSTDVTIEESSAGNKPTPAPISTGLFREVSANDIKNVVAYPISYADCFNPDFVKNEELQKQEEKDIKAFKEGQKKQYFENVGTELSFKYEPTSFHYAPELSPVAINFFDNEQSTYHQSDGACVFNAVTELTNKTLIAQNLISKDSIRDTRMSRAQISYNGLFVTKDPLDGFHGDYLGKDGHYTTQDKLNIIQRRKINKTTDNKRIANIKKDFRYGNNSAEVIHSLFSGMGPIKEKADDGGFFVRDERGYNLCNLGSISGENNSASVSKDNDLYTEDLYNNIYAHLTQKRDFDKNNRDLIKAWIHSYGAVGFSSKKVIDEKTKRAVPPIQYYNFTYNSMYNYPANHALIIVGWDDNFPAQAFNTPDGSINTKTNGAWLVKNSLNDYVYAKGEDGKYIKDKNGKNIIDYNYLYEPDKYLKEKKEFCRSGDSYNTFDKLTPFSLYRYFWLSYDSPLANNFYGIAFENKDYFDNIYQYDGYQENFEYKYKDNNKYNNKESKLIDSSKAANIFTVKNPDTAPQTSNNAQELKCVSFETNKSGTYKVEIYKILHDEENEDGSPTNGTRVDSCTTVIKCPTKGTYTVELNNTLKGKSNSPLLFAPGDQYSVIITSTSKNGGKIAIEDNEDPNDSRDTHKGESFVYNKSTEKWVDLHDIEDETKIEENKTEITHWPENLRIKAMTVNTDIDSSTINTTPVDPTPTVAPTSTPVSDCAKLSLKAKINRGLIGFECMIETDENSPLTDQLKTIQITGPDKNGTQKTIRNSLTTVKKTKTETGSITRSVFMPIKLTTYENTYKFEILDGKNRPINIQLPGDGINEYTTAYTISMKEYLDKLKDTAIANNDSATENFANALMIHMACAQSIYKTTPADDVCIDLSALNDINVSDFSGDRVTRSSSDTTDDSIIFRGLNYNWTRTSDLSVIYNVTDASAIKSIQIDGNDISDSSNDSYQIDENNGQQVLTVNLSGIPISDFAKKHTITVENENGNQVVVNVSVYSYIYSTLKTKYTDQTTKNYTKSLALLKDTYDQLDKNDSRYKDFFIF